MPIKFSRKPKQPRPASDFRNATTMMTMSGFIVLLSLLSLAGVFIFLRASILTTIDEVESLVFVQPGEAIEIIDFRRLDSVLEKWQEKEEIQTPSLYRNPFVSDTQRAASVPQIETPTEGAR